MSRLVPATVEGQMVGVLTVSFLVVLSVLVTLEIVDRSTAIEWAEAGATMNRLERMQIVLENIEVDRRAKVLESVSACHDGYTLTANSYAMIDDDARTGALESRIAQRLAIGAQNVSVGFANLDREDFAYGKCSESEINLPMSAIVVSIRLRSGEWFNTEVHPHEWHLQDLIEMIFRYGAALALVGAGGIFLIRRVSKPLNSLTHAARSFADGLNVSPVAESGPPDLRRAIHSFNAMQRQVAEDIKRRTDTLAAISHDLRTPLTALRIRAEMVDDNDTRHRLVGSIDKMEKIIASALEFLKGESRSEPRRMIDLGTMLASECSEFEEAGQRATFVCENGVHYSCRPEALARAVRNLIENANKYGDGATVDLRIGADRLDIVVSDTGPGIPEEKTGAALEPFHRLSKARESHHGGFGLGLSIAQAVARGHGGELVLSHNDPTGLIAIIRLPTMAT